MHSRISEIVKKSGLTKTDFAKRLGLSQPFVSRICSGDAIPSDRTIVDICQEFGCNEVWLRTGEGEAFRELSKEEEIMRFAVKTVRGTDEFRKALVSMLAKLEPEDWENLSRVYAKLTDEYKKTE